MPEAQRSVVPRRLRRSLGIGLLLVLGAWFGRYAYLRLTVMPPVPVDEMFDSLPGGEPDETGREIGALLDKLHQIVPFTPPDPPAGYEGEWAYWGTLDVGYALRGPWEPENRPHLRAVIAHLRDPDTQAVLHCLHALRGREWSYDGWGALRPAGDDAPWTGLVIRSRVRVLMSDARRQIAEHQAPDAAIENVRTALWLADGLVQTSLLTLLVARACEEGTFQEVRHWAREHQLDQQTLAHLQSVVADVRPLPEFWGSCMEGERQFVQCIIDALYTLRADGNGWYVLSRYSAVRPHFDWRFSDAAQRTALWNLLSMFYNDRATVEARLRAYVTGWSTLPELTYAEAGQVVDRLMHRPEMFNVLDGRPLGDDERLWRGYQLVLLGEMQRRGTLIVLALERHWLDHGEYPETLAALVPGYLESLPADPFADGPFGYRRNEAGGYVLWSHGPDGDDDGGSTGDELFEDGDFAFTTPREEATAEPRLRPLDSADGDPNHAFPWDQEP